MLPPGSGPEALSPTPATPARSRSRVSVFAARFTGWIIGLHFVAIFLTVACCELIGERFWPLAVFLYLPPLILALPLFVLVPAAMLFGPSRGPWIMLGAT